MRAASSLPYLLVVLTDPFVFVTGRGLKDLVIELLKRGADRTLKAGNWTALDLAEQMNQSDIVAILKNDDSADDSKNVALFDSSTGAQDAEHAESLLRIYHERRDEETINFDLLVDLLFFLEQQNLDGAVLIFLPGYEDIMAVRDRILDNGHRYGMSNRFEVTLDLRLEKKVEY